MLHLAEVGSSMNWRIRLTPFKTTSNGHALHLAAEFGHAAAAGALLDGGAQPRARDHDGATPLDHATAAPKTRWTADDDDDQMRGDDRPSRRDLVALLRERLAAAAPDGEDDDDGGGGFEEECEEAGGAARPREDRLPGDTPMAGSSEPRTRVRVDIIDEGGHDTEEQPTGGAVALQSK